MSDLKVKFFSTCKAAS